MEAFKVRSPDYRFVKMEPTREGYKVTALYKVPPISEGGAERWRPFAYNVNAELRYGDSDRYDVIPNWSCVTEYAKGGDVSATGCGDTPRLVEMCGSAVEAAAPFNEREKRLAAARDAARQERDGLRKLLEGSYHRLAEMTRGRDGAHKTIDKLDNERRSRVHLWMRLRDTIVDQDSVASLREYVEMAAVVAKEALG